MELLSENIYQLGGVALGAAAVAAVALMGESVNRADVEELTLLQEDALRNARSAGTFTSENTKGAIILGTASRDNSEGMVSALMGIGIHAEVSTNSYIAVNLSQFLKDASTQEENSLYDDLIKVGLILSPTNQTGVFHALRAHYDDVLILQTCQRFQLFIKKRSSAAIPQTVEKIAEIKADPIESMSADEEEQSMLVESPLNTPVRVMTSRAARSTKAKTTVTKTTGKGRKRKVEEEEDDKEGDLESVQTDDFMTSTWTPASVAKTPAARRKSTAVDSINGDVSSTARKGRSRRSVE